MRKRRSVHPPTATPQEAASDDEGSSGKPKKRRSVGVHRLGGGGGGAKLSAVATLDEDKASKGLRHFSMKVCKKVEAKGTTTYNEVADELVAEFLHLGTTMDSVAGKPAFDEKNIRRRVYDALNVLMAMDIISKAKKEIKWIGLPSNAVHDKEALTTEKARLERSVEAKREHLALLLEQRVIYANLVGHNARKEALRREAKEAAKEDAAAAAAAGTVTAHAHHQQQAQAQQLSQQESHAHAGAQTPSRAAVPAFSSSSSSSSSMGLDATPLGLQTPGGGCLDLPATPVGLSAPFGLGSMIAGETPGGCRTPGSEAGDTDGGVGRGGRGGGGSGARSLALGTPATSALAAAAGAAAGALEDAENAGRGDDEDDCDGDDGEGDDDEDDDDVKIALPFIVITTSKDTAVACDMDEPRSSVKFEFSDAFEVHDDATVLGRLGLGTVASREDLLRMFPPRFHPYLSHTLVAAPPSGAVAAPPSGAVAAPPSGAVAAPPSGAVAAPAAL